MRIAHRIDLPASCLVILETPKENSWTAGVCVRTIAGMPPSLKPEFPPLLPGPGFHPMTMQQLCKRCVDDFPLSQTRREIMNGFSSVVQILIAVGIVGHMWVDGSFLTQKIDPEDVDLLLRISLELYENATSEQMSTIEWFAQGEQPKTDYHCDCYIWVEIPPGHPAYIDSEERREYWTRQYGLSRRNEHKGIAVVELPGGAA